MMQDLNHALKGGYKMELEDKNVEAEVIEAANEEETTSEVIEDSAVEETPVEETSEAIDVADEEIEEENKEEETIEESEEIEEENAEENEEIEETSEEVEKENVEDYSLLKEEFDKLKADYTAMETKYQELVTFKEAVENEKKDALINSFYMLSDEDKKDVVENKSKYSYDEIKAKLAIICFDKKVNFDLENTSENEENIDKEEKVVTYSLDSNNTEVLPAWLSAVKRTRDSKEN
jgi:predicted nuclease with TOPRIM domain